MQTHANPRGAARAAQRGANPLWSRVTSRGREAGMRRLSSSLLALSVANDQTTRYPRRRPAVLSLEPWDTDPPQL